MSETHQPPIEQLPGFTLTERLGAGGYGEVWRATAPGGLEKAVKYVFGGQDETRATSEMKAMQRIKSVRHPFLLSLERIEIVEGRLVVVTELADGSLRDRYHACIKEDLPGIPRDELLNYLRDTADALDFLSERHDLQHLDIKPENLLLLAGHVKVADFGLVKSISNQTQSLVGGMTPTYAAPEVFQGTPSKHSDQYSLAIMYQELLTGALPFPGSNAAELTMQHLNDQPNLGTLCESDRFAISRALSKDPSYRFDNCGELVQTLLSGPSSPDPSDAPAHSTAPKRRLSQPALDKSAKTYSATEVFEETTDTETHIQPSMLLDLPELSEHLLEEANLPEVDTEEFTPSPALFIGIGRTAGLVLKGLKERLAAQYDGGSCPPTLQMLLLDSNSRDLQAVSRGGELGNGLCREETVPLPLRRPQGYRDKAPDVLNWLGRRWLYNIPRSLETEGIRPLGRLALIDHARQAFQRIRRAMTECVSEDSHTVAQETTGVEFRKDRLRVYIVSSISGGTGSGMVLDVAYAAKSILKRLNLEESQVIGIMTHSTSRDARRRELSRVNAYSCLSEYRHYSRPGSAYPGDQGCGLPAHDERETAFDHGYFIDLGDGLDELALDPAAQAVSDYLLLDSVSPAQTLLDQCRKMSADEDLLPHVRSFAILREESLPADAISHLQRKVTRRLIKQWAGEQSQDQSRAKANDSTILRSTNPLVPGAAQLTKRLKLDAAGLASLGRSLIEAQLGGDAEGILQATNQESDLALSSCEELLRPIASLFSEAPSKENDLNNIAAVGGLPLPQLILPLRKKLSAELAECILSRVDQPNERFGGAFRAVDWYSDHLVSIDNDLSRLQETTTQQIAQSLGAATSINWSQSGREAAIAWQLQHGKKVFDLAAVTAAKTILGGIQNDLSQLPHRISELQSTLLDSHSSVTNQSTAEDHPELDQNWQGQVSEVLESAETELGERLEREFLLPRGGLRNLLSASQGVDLLADAIERASHLVATQHLARVSQQNTTGQQIEQPSDLLPKHAEKGRRVRRFTACSQDNVAAGSKQASKANLCQVASPNAASYHIAEVEGLSLPHVAADLIGRRRDYSEFAARVHTRQDVSWTDILEHNDTSAEISPAAAAVGVQNTCQLTSPVAT